MELMEHQELALSQLSNGKILWGGVGTGKSAVAVAYYEKCERPKHVYVITTARKRDDLDWEKEFAAVGVSGTTFIKDETYLQYAGVLTVDSWNQIANYEDVEDAFFIFDEQRVVGSGSWSKSFLRIAKKNNWILLSGTPGDNWLDYIPVFLANGYYKNKTVFMREHVLYEPFRKFPVVRGYLNENKLELLRNEILVEMPYLKHTEPVNNWLEVGFDQNLFRRVYKERWHVYENRPIKDIAEMWRVIRRIINSDPSRLELVKKLLTCHDRLIIFYNFDYELDILRTLSDHIPTYEWNGHKKNHNSEFELEPRWVYLVQYVAGAEAWNCTTTDAMVLYSLTYSYKNFIQAKGRNDRLDTPYTTLYYYMFVSNSILDKRVRGALDRKEDFNERKFAREIGESGEIVELGVTGIDGI